MSQSIPEQRRKELQAFSSLLKLVEASTTIPGQRENFVLEDVPNSSAIIAAGQALATIINQVLNCRYVGVFAVDPPGECQRLLGISGLNPEQELQIRAATDHTPLLAYISQPDIDLLHINQIVRLDLKQKSFMTPRPTFGARYRLLTPMMSHDQLIGFFTIAKTEEEHPNVQSAYTPEDIALAKGIAQITVLVIEQVRLLERWAEAHANELALEEINHRYDAFLTIACHELRTPLTSIKGNIQLMLRRMEALKRHQEQSLHSADISERFQHLLENAVDNVAKLERITRELLDVARVQAKRLDMVMQICNLVKITQHIVEDIQHTAVDRTLVLSLPAEKVILIRADPDRIGQIITNYLSNALKYSPADQPIEIKLNIEGPVARVTVRDEGPGLTQEEQSHIWERFYRAPGVKVQNGQVSDANLGLGLHLCSEIIERHQGHAGVESVPGKGSLFWFTLPLAAENIQTTE